MATKNEDKSTLSPAQLNALEAAYSDADKSLAARVAAVWSAFQTVGTVKEVRAQMIAAGIKGTPTVSVLGHAHAAGYVLDAVGFANVDKVATVHRATLVRFARDKGAPAIKTAARDTLKVLTTGDKAERLAAVLEAIERLEDIPSRAAGKRTARPNDGEDVGGDGAETADVPTVTAGTAADAGKAVAQSLAHALALLEGGATFTDHAAELFDQIAAVVSDRAATLAAA